MARTKRVASGEIQIKADDEFPGGVVEGFASTFDNVDLHGDVIRRGAFAESIGTFKRGQEIPFVDNHRVMDGTGAVLGSVIHLEETATGLFFKAALSARCTRPKTQAIRKSRVHEGILDSGCRLAFLYSERWFASERSMTGVVEHP